MLTALLLCLTACLATAQDVIRVTGTVVSKTKNLPLFGANIVDAPSGRLMATTDEDGRFAINVRSNTTLRVSMVGAKVATVKVKGQTFLKIELEEEDVFLGEAVATVKRITDKVQPEPTDIEVRGNYFCVKTRVRVPREMFSHDTRLVVQPVINNVTRKELKLMRPMVYDAQEYNRTQDRLYNFDMDASDGDPLAKYVTVKSDSTRESGRTNDIIGYTDSIYVDNVKDEYTCDIYMAIEDYRHILYRDTTIIARGTVNPMRWLDYSFNANEITDSAYFPKPEVQLRDSKGQIDLRFPIGKAQFDTADPHNLAETEKLRKQLEQIAREKDATLNSLAIDGTSSPDGRYSSNLTLAQKRMDFAIGYLRSKLPEEMRSHMKFTSNAKVAPWADVISLMRADSLYDEAKQVENIAMRYDNIDMQSRAMRKLPFYTRLLEGKYLPQLRRVGYVMNYSIFRQLTIAEIDELYQKDYRQLSRFEFFQLYRNEKNAERRETILRQALEMYPSFMVAANDLQTILINRQESDAELLAPFAGQKAPVAVNANHMIALLNAGQYTRADSIAQFLPDMESTHLLLAVSNALNGHYEDSYQTIAQTGKRNEVVMLLAMKRNKEALEASKALPDDEAMTHYLRAVCLNRAEKPVEAYDELEKAFKMDPSLERMAHIDGDVNDLLLDKTK